jgi:hypothetical protein
MVVLPYSAVTGALRHLQKIYAEIWNDSLRFTGLKRTLVNGCFFQTDNMPGFAKAQTVRFILKQLAQAARLRHALAEFSPA